MKPSNVFYLLTLTKLNARHYYQIFKSKYKILPSILVSYKTSSSQNQICNFSASDSSQGLYPIRLCVHIAHSYGSIFLYFLFLYTVSISYFFVRIEAQVLPQVHVIPLYFMTAFKHGNSMWNLTVMIIPHILSTTLMSRSC